MHTSTHTETLVADHAVLKKLGRWTEATTFSIRARRSSVVLDLRAIDQDAPIEIVADADHSVITLLAPPNATVDAEDLRWTGSGRVHDAGSGSGESGIRVTGAGLGESVIRVTGAGLGESVIRVTGTAHDSQLRVHRGGVAQLTAMLSRAYLRELRQTARTGAYPTIDDPARPQR